MANRPRRPRSNGAPLGGDEAEKPTAAGAAEDTGTSSGSPVEPGVPETGAQTDAGRPDGASLPPLETQPAIPVATPEQQREGEASGGSDQQSDEATGPAGFAAEEGFADKSETRPASRHLGEFEDDETVSADERERPRVAGATTAFESADRSTVAGPGANGGASGSALLGAGLAGAVLALLGGSVLAYSGLLPGVGASNGTQAQYAAAGDLEMLASEMTTLRGTVEQLQSAQAAGGSGGDYATTQDLAVVADRLTAAEQSLADVPAGPDEGSLQALQEAQDGAGAARSAAEAAQNTADEAQAAATEIEATVGELAGRLDAQDGRLAALEEANEVARLSLAAAGLKAAIDRGGGFEPELELFASAGGSASAEALRPFAAEGVPTRAELAADWPAAEAELRRALVQPAGEAGVGDQLLAGLSSLVTVRSTGEPAAEDTGPEAAITRMGTAIEAGDYSGFLEQWESLDPAVQGAAEGFADGVRARAEAAGVVDDALANAANAAPGTEG